MTGLRRRSFLGTLGVVLVAGCVSADDDASQPESTDSEDQAAADDEETAGEPESREETVNGYETNSDRADDLERLPDRSPLAEPLKNLYIVTDREGYAATIDRLDYADGFVDVVIELEPDADPPWDYVADDARHVGQYVMGDVDVDRLVDLALEGAVRMVRLPADAETHAGG